MRPKSAFHQVLDRMGRDVVNDEWPTGHPIDPRALQAKLGVSHSIIREVVRVLEDKGLLIARPNSGTRVRPTTDWNLLDADVVRWIAASPHHPELKIQAKEFAEALLMLAPAFGDNPFLTRALATLGEPESEAA